MNFRGRNRQDTYDSYINYLLVITFIKLVSRILSMKRSVLDSGITVISEQKETDTGTAFIGIDYGARFDGDKRGLAHLLEHMLFVRGSKELMDDIGFYGARLGENYGPITYIDTMMCFIRVPGRHLSSGLNILSGLIENPQFNESAIESEKIVVKREIEAYHNLPKMYSFQRMLETLYPDHICGKSIAGTTESLKRITADDLQKAYDTYFGPDNMVVSVAGNMGHDDAIKSSRRLSQRKPCNAAETDIIAMPERVKARRILDREGITQAYIFMGTLTAPQASEDTVALDVIKESLYKRMFDKVRGEHKLSYNMKCSHEQGLDWGHMSIYAEVDPARFEEAERVLGEQISDIAAGRISERELLCAKNSLSGLRMVRRDDTLYSVMDSVEGELLCKDCRWPQKYIKRVSKLDMPTVRKVAKEYLETDKYVTIGLLPKT